MLFICKVLGTVIGILIGRKLARISIEHEEEARTLELLKLFEDRASSWKNYQTK